MSDSPRVGTIGWIDLTVKNCEEIRDFYQAVVGWDVLPVDMEGYQDFSMAPPAGGEPAAGICHARGDNADLPPQWLIYIRVEDLDVSIARCLALGGRLLTRPRGLGSHGTMCVIQDPTGAVAALVSPPPLNET